MTMLITKDGVTQTVDEGAFRSQWQPAGWVEVSASTPNLAAPEFVPGASYEPGQLVWQDGVLYRAKAAFVATDTFNADNWDAAGGGVVLGDRLCIAKSITVPTGDGPTQATFDVADLDTGEIFGTAFSIVDGEKAHILLDGNYLLFANITWPSNTLGTYRLAHLDDTACDGFPADSVTPPADVGTYGLRVNLVHCYPSTGTGTIEINLEHDAGVEQVVWVRLNAVRIGQSSA